MLINTVINIPDLKTNYYKYLDNVICGKEILLGQHDKTVAKIIALAAHTNR
jgi:antitoxin (DNA-binding transcriptional repressor) of toxin-antitoxin stability system